MIDITTKTDAAVVHVFLAIVRLLTTSLEFALCRSCSGGARNFRLGGGYSPGGLQDGPPRVGFRGEAPIGGLRTPKAKTVCRHCLYRVGQKSKPHTDVSINCIKTFRASYFFVIFLKLNVEQTTEVNANKHLLVLNILSIKYSMYDVKCDVNYCVYTHCPGRRPTHHSICC